jgi:hypothetical protein
VNRTEPIYRNSILEPVGVLRVKALSLIFSIDFREEKRHPPIKAGACPFPLLVDQKLSDDQFPVQHVHPAGERELAALFRSEFHRRCFVRGEVPGDPEIAEYHLLAAG